ncbi:MAG: SOS response-associated peptidase [Planctomycetaceae bacterium]|nr:SOS response-associated peptidase [Planctomycetaceae bacterium]
MCGRFTNIGRAIILAYKLGLIPFPPMRRYNIAPTQSMTVAVRGDAGPEWMDAKWGLVPSWSRDATFAARCINAKAETASEKPTYRDAFRLRRCLVPASGFYEWRREPGSKKRTPFYFSPRDGDELAFAGLWEVWRGGGEDSVSFTILTTAADATVAPVHDRMPVILPPDKWEAWLDPGLRDAGQVDAFLHQVRDEGDGVLQSWQVGPYVNSVTNDGPHCIERAG